MPALLIYLFFGLAIAFRLFPERPGTLRVWLGLVFGCIGMMWLPCLAALILDFTRTANWLAVGFALAAGLTLTLLPRRAANVDPACRERDTAREWLPIAACLALTGLCAYLLGTHVLLEAEDGSLWVGQSTYGDLAMHLGFIESLYVQGTFPPEYSILPGAQLDYPFLVDAASAGLRFFGLGLRGSVIAPSIVMLWCVFYGFYRLAARLLRRRGAALAALALFAFNGGFGFTLFFEKYSLHDLMTGFYVTPTNLTDEGIRWVNVICDMLIPQRTTMAGWCVGLAALWLLFEAVETTVRDGKNARRLYAALGVAAGAMPMIHTHSFLALGLFSAGAFFARLPEARRRGTGKKLFTGFVLYGLLCAALALPQLLYWTFDYTSSGSRIEWHPGWLAPSGQWLWFWIVNGGIVFIGFWPALWRIKKAPQLAAPAAGALLTFAVANLVSFQPNLYDNNKLLYFWYMAADILCCGAAAAVWDRMRCRAVRAALCAALLGLGTVSGLMSLARECVSEYQLIDADSAAAAAYIHDETEPDALFLTATNHNNAVAVLTGRSIVCGSGSFLYFHGLNYSEREAQVIAMLAGGEAFWEGVEEYGIDYVYLSDYERSAGADEAFFRANLTPVFEQGRVTVFRVDTE